MTCYILKRPRKKIKILEKLIKLPVELIHKKVIKLKKGKKSLLFTNQQFYSLLFLNIGLYS